MEVSFIYKDLMIKLNDVMQALMVPVMRRCTLMINDDRQRRKAALIMANNLGKIVALYW